MMLETRKKFHEELDDLETALQRLGELAASLGPRAVAALIENDPERSQKVIDDDDAIDELYLEIDQGVLALLALQAPVASDLRLVSALMHCCLHLERIGDQAVNVAKTAPRLRRPAGERRAASAAGRDGTPRRHDGAHRDGGASRVGTSSCAGPSRRWTTRSTG